MVLVMGMVTVLVTGNFMENIKICQWCENNTEDVTDHIIENFTHEKQTFKEKVIICLPCYQMYDQQMAYDKSI